jgi:hypothetical protein
LFSTTALTVPAPDDAGRVNEDMFVVGPNWWLVLDGATAPNGRVSGCIHDVPWLVRTLASRLAYDLTCSGTQISLTRILAGAIHGLCLAHADTCDLSNPDSPSTTVAITRADTNGGLEYIALADSPLLIETDEGVQLVHDDRTAYLTDRTLDGISRARNSDTGFWVASTRPEAAEYAKSGRMDNVQSFAMLTDGASRWKEMFGLGTWAELHKSITEYGPAAVIARVRGNELEQGMPPRGKQYDDATIVLAHQMNP